MLVVHRKNNKYCATLFSKGKSQDILVDPATVGYNLTNNEVIGWTATGIWVANILSLQFTFWPKQLNKILKD